MSQCEAIDQPNKETIRDIIKRLLQDFPGITRSMINVHTSSVAREVGEDFTQILNEMVSDGVIKIEDKTRSNGRVVQVYSLTAQEVHGQQAE